MNAGSFCKALLATSLAWAFVAPLPAANDCSMADRDRDPAGRQEEQQKSKGEWLEEAINLSSIGKYAQASEVLRGARRQFPEDLQLIQTLLRMLSIEIRRAGAAKQFTAARQTHLEMAAVAREYVAIKPNDTQLKKNLAIMLLNEARVLAATGENEKSVSALKLALEWGYDDLAVILADKELSEVVELPASRELFATYLEEHRQQLARQATAELEAFDRFEFDFDLPGLDSESLKLSDFRGKVVVVDLWGSWCPPCRVTVPILVKLRETFGSGGLEVVGIAFERVRRQESQPNLEQIREFLEKHGADYPCATGSQEVQKQLREQLRDWRGFPTAVLVDRSGQVRMMLTGAKKYHELEAYVTILLAESASEK